MDTWFVTKWPTVDEVCALPQGGDEHPGYLPAEERESWCHRGCAQQHSIQPQRIPCGGVHRRHPGTGPGWMDLGLLLSHGSHILKPGPASLPHREVIIFPCTCQAGHVGQGWFVGT